jgi:hypothetical protein
VIVEIIEQVSRIDIENEPNSVVVVQPEVRIIDVAVQGPAGQGVPVGGATGQVLKKQSAVDFDTAWQNESGGGGGAVISVFSRTGAVTAQVGDYTTALVPDSTNKRYVTDAGLVVLGNTSGVNTGDQTNITGNAGTVTTINGRITAGTNVTISGSGTAGSPYNISATGGGGGGTPAGSTGQIQFNTSGAFDAEANLFYDKANDRLGIGTDAPDATMHLKKAGYTPTLTLPGDLISRLAENGAADGQRSLFSLHHAYHPAFSFDVYSFVLKTGYDLPSYPPLEMAISLGAFYGEAQFSLKGLGLRFDNTGSTISESNFPSANSLRTRLGTLSSSYYVEDSYSENSFSFSYGDGFRVNVDYFGTILLNTSATLGGTLLKGRYGTSKPLVVRGQSGQTENLTEWQNSAATALSYVRADGSLKPVSLADSAATNDSIYYSTTASKLVYKDSGGTVNALY